MTGAASRTLAYSTVGNSVYETKHLYACRGTVKHPTEDMLKESCKLNGTLGKEPQGQGGHQPDLARCFCASVSSGSQQCPPAHLGVSCSLQRQVRLVVMKHCCQRGRRGTT